MRNNADPEQYVLSSLSNALDILNTLSTRPDMGVTELSQKTGLGKASVFRTLYTLERKGFVRKTTDSRYALGMQLAVLGKVADRQMDDYSVLHYILEDLARQTNMTAYLSILTRSCQMLFLDSAFGNALLQSRIKSGSVGPAHYSGGGKVLLASLLGTAREPELNRLELPFVTESTVTDPARFRAVLEETRLRGYGEDLGESQPELVCYGVPVTDRAGGVLCALSLSGPRQAMLENRAHFLPKLKESAAHLAAQSDLLQQYISHYSHLL